MKYYLISFVFLLNSDKFLFVRLKFEIYLNNELDLSMSSQQSPILKFIKFLKLLGLNIFSSFHHLSKRLPFIQTYYTAK